MADPMLMKGISFRRQGSSGVTWADGWTVTENGVLVVEGPRERPTKPGVRAPSQVLNPRHTASGTSALFPNNSVRDAPPAIDINNKTAVPDKKGSRSRFMRWVKRAFRKPRA